MFVKNSKSKSLNVLPGVDALLADYAESLGVYLDLDQATDAELRFDSQPRVLLYTEIINATQYPIWVKHRDGTLLRHDPCHSHPVEKNFIRIITGYHVPQAKHLTIAHESDHLLGHLTEDIDCPLWERAKIRVGLANGSYDRKRIPSTYSYYSKTLGSPILGERWNYRRPETRRGFYHDYKLDGITHKVAVDYHIDQFTGDSGRYVPEIDMVVSTSELIAMSTIHPYSQSGIKAKKQLYGNKISNDIYIVDNNDKYHTRYGTVCGVVIEIPMVVDPSQKDGYYFSFYKPADNNPTITERKTLYYTVEEADQKGLIRSKREEFEIESRQRQLDLAEEKLAIDRERFEQEKIDRNIARKDNWINSRIKELLDLAKIIVPLGVSLLTLYLKMKKSV